MVPGNGDWILCISSSHGVALLGDGTTKIMHVSTGMVLALG
jgi:hypothetical protein